MKNNNTVVRRHYVPDPDAQASALQALLTHANKRQKKAGAPHAGEDGTEIEKGNSAYGRSIPK